MDAPLPAGHDRRRRPMAGEFDFISWLARQPSIPSPHVAVGVGDDLAVLRPRDGDFVLLGIDQVLDGVHFDSAVHGLRAIGRKAVNRNLSDCAAMACRPAAAVLSLAVPRGGGTDLARELFLGARAAGEAHGCPIVGGDTGSWAGPLAVTVAILGTDRKDPGHPNRPVTRAGARPGDAVAVSGPLGGSILGRHMTFEPRLDFAHFLCDLTDVSAMIDLSDGLSRDLRHVCDASGVGAVIRAADVPVHPDAVELSRRDGRPPLFHALHDGEDYELLFTAATLPAGGPRNTGGEVVPIGRIVAEPGVWLERADGRREPLVPLSWEHAL